MIGGGSETASLLGSTHSDDSDYSTTHLTHRNRNAHALHDDGGESGQHDEKQHALAAQEDLDKDIAPLPRKIGFALGAFGSMATHTAVGFYLSPFLLEIVGVPPAVVSVCTLLGRVWDAITDPTVGLMVAKTRTKWGCLKPWITLSIIPAAVSFLCIWIVVPFSLAGQSVYYIVMYLLYQTFFSAYQVPYTSLTMHISHNPKQRDQATAFRMLIETVGLICGSAVISSVLQHFAPPAGSCVPCSDDDDYFDGTDAGSSAHYVDQGSAHGFLLGAGLIAVLSAICGFCLVFLVPEKKNLYPPKPESTLASLKEIKRNKAYITLVLMFMWAWMANNVNQANLLLWLKYGFGKTDNLFTAFLMVFVATSTLMLPAWYYFMNKYGKPLCFAVGLMIQVPYSLVQAFLPPDVPNWVLFLGTIVSAIGVGAVYLIPWAMLPDVIDHAEVLYGKRKDAVYYSFFVFFQKAGSGVAIGFSTLALQFADFKSHLCCGESQPESVRKTLLVLSTFVPCTLLILSLFFTSFYTLGKAKVEQNKAILANRRADKSREDARRKRAKEAGQPLPDDFKIIEASSSSSHRGNAKKPKSNKPLRGRHAANASDDGDDQDYDMSDNEDISSTHSDATEVTTM